MSDTDDQNVNAVEETETLADSDGGQGDYSDADGNSANRGESAGKATVYGVYCAKCLRGAAAERRGVDPAF